MRDRSSPQARYAQQRQRALARGIPWELTFDQWMAIWRDSGKFELRGKKTGQYVMARRGDVGPYSESNVFICLFSDNIKDAYKNKPCGGWLNLGRGRGWTYRDGHAKPFQVTFRRKYVGVFATQTEAEAAYDTELKNFARSST